MGPRVVKEFSDGSSLEYDRGKFDDWCVYERTPEGVRSAPRDTDYFRALDEFAAEIGSETVYSDFVRLYEVTAGEIADSTLVLIDEISKGYGSSGSEAAKTYATLYMGMVAEEQKSYTKLGKRVKRLGVHKLLIEGEPVEVAAHFMRGKKWQEIAALCEERGF